MGNLFVHKDWLEICSLLGINVSTFSSAYHSARGGVLWSEVYYCKHTRQALGPSSASEVEVGVGGGVPGRPEHVNFIEWKVSLPFLLSFCSSSETFGIAPTHLNPPSNFCARMHACVYTSCVCLSNSSVQVIEAGNRGFGGRNGDRLSTIFRCFMHEFGVIMKPKRYRNDPLCFVVVLNLNAETPRIQAVSWSKFINSPGVSFSPPKKNLPQVYTYSHTHSCGFH